MKKILLSIICFFYALCLSAQFVHKIKADSVLITNDSCTAELIIENRTKDTLGFLYNKGKGRTEFRSGSGAFILNQFGTPQPARVWVAGQIRTDSMIRIGQLPTDPTPANGIIYYNTTTNRFRAYGNLVWQNLLTGADVSNGLRYNTTSNKIELGGEDFISNPLSRNTCINLYDGTNSYKFRINGGQQWVPGNVVTFDRLNGTIFSGINGSFNNLPVATRIVRIGNFDEAGSDVGEGNGVSDMTNLEIFNNGWATNGVFKGAVIRLNGSFVSNNYNLTGLEINSRSHNISSFDIHQENAGNIALKLTANSVGAQGWLKARTYAIYADSGRVYSRDTVMFGTTTPGAFFHVNGTTRFDLGSDATGDLFYRNSTGQFTRLPIGTNGQVLSVQSGLPTWTTDKLKVTATLDFPNTSSLSSSTLNVTVTGASVGDHVMVAKADGTSSNGELYTATVSATNTVTVRYQNVSGSAVDLASASYNVTVIKF